MTTKKTATTTTRKKALPPELPSTFYRVSALLHTMRCIAQHEDKLCVLMNHIKRTKAVSPSTSKELKTLLEELPSHEYTDDLQAILATLTEPPTRAKKPKSSSPK